MYLLSFELTSNKDELIIHGDPGGLRFLCDEIERLIERLIANTEEGGFDHTHLKTEAWAGNELTSESQGDELLNHVKKYCWRTKEGR